jgi:hypothetical protein
MRRITIAVIAAIMSIAALGAASAHSGGTDAQGCHPNHKTGDYHCP